MLPAKKETTSRFKTGTTQKGTPGGKSSPLFSLLQKIQDVKESYDISDTAYMQAVESGNEQE